MRKMIFIIILLLSTFFVYPQENNNHKFGIFGGMNYNLHNADFNKLAGIPNCCPRFESGSGYGFNAGLLHEFRLSRQLWFGTRLGVLTLDGFLKNEEFTTILTETGPIQGAFEHKLEAAFLNLGIEPTLVYNPFGGLLINGGLRFGLNLIKNYDQIETITKPDGVGTFLDELGNDSGLRTRNKFSGEIPNALPFQIFALGGISYELPLNKSNSLMVAPEIQYYFPINEMVENTHWKVNSFRLGLALKYAPIPVTPKQEIFERKYEIDTIRVPSDLVAQQNYRKGEEKKRKDKFEDSEKIINLDIISRTDTLLIPKIYNLSGRITVVGVDRDRNEIPNPIFKIEEFISNRLYPLLNYIFFEENSFVLPDRYKKILPNEINTFEMVQLFRDSTLQIYHNILNIIGLRMKENPTAKITLIGCNSDMGEEKENRELSKKRAETVKLYLTGVWKIQDERIRIQVRNLPKKPSTPIDEPDKTAENRRVEIESDNEKILAPIFIEKIDRIPNPPIARFKLNADAEAGLKNWEILSYQKSDMDNPFKYGGVDTIEPYVDWELSHYQKIIPKTAEPIFAEFKLEDKKGETYITQTQTSPVEVITVKEKRVQKIGDYEIEKFSLILFDFDKATIEGNNKKIVNFIKDRIKPESQIEIIGYTDRTGNPDYNFRLAEKRAYNTQQAINRKDGQAMGDHKKKLLYDNDLPEGRFYCRTVDIIVSTKIK